jgi:hypothetical protein
MEHTKFSRSFAIRLIAAIALPCLLTAIYLLLIRPSHLQWGATAEEVARALPGDGIVPSPNFCATRAITIQGKPEDIWPWLAQMGYRRAGFYGYDLIENIGAETGIRSATSILPDLQHPKSGDVLPISPVASLVFGSVQPNNYLIWRGEGNQSNGSFLWVLYPVDASHTRLVSRVRIRYHSDRRLLLDLFTEFADPVAVPRILLGVKERVEGRPSPSLTSEAIEILVWFLALAEFAVAIVFVLRWHHWGRAWLLELAAGLVWLFVLYARAPIWLGVVLVGATFGAMLLSKRADSRIYSRA